MIAGEEPDDTCFIECFMALHSKGRSLEQIDLIKNEALKRSFRRAEREALKSMESQSAILAGGDDP